jgi:hypothetical protein
MSDAPWHRGRRWSITQMYLLDSSNGEFGNARCSVSHLLWPAAQVLKNIAASSRQLLISRNCVFDASLVPQTCPDGFSDSRKLINQVYGESCYRKVDDENRVATNAVSRGSVPGIARCDPKRLRAQ